MANAVLLGGHGHIEDRVILGGSAVIHQFCRIGQLAMVGGGGRRGFVRTRRSSDANDSE